MVTYEGEWKADYYHRQGRVPTKSGSVYEGNFVENKKGGKGKMKFPSTDKFLAEYDGDWKGDVEGQGKVTFKDGTTYCGGFKDGAFEGRGTFKRPNGGHFRGYFVNGIRHGQDKETFPNGHTLEGEWKLGKRMAASPTPKIQGKPANRIT